MEQIKIITLQSVQHFSAVLSNYTKKTQDEIQYKVLDFIFYKGKRNFIDIYNEAFSDKKFEEALKILNI